jgi:hypothetical protein
VTGAERRPAASPTTTCHPPFALAHQCETQQLQSNPQHELVHSSVRGELVPADYHSHKARMLTCSILGVGRRQSTSTTPRNPHPLRQTLTSCDNSSSKARHSTAESTRSRRQCTRYSMARPWRSLVAPSWNVRLAPDTEFYQHRTDIP